jgi:hypothetical protein
MPRAKKENGDRISYVGDPVPKEEVSTGAAINKLCTIGSDFPWASWLSTIPRKLKSKNPPACVPHMLYARLESVYREAASECGLCVFIVERYK